MNAQVLRIRSLHKSYRGRHTVRANDGIDLTIAPGEVVGLLGHNGAGKTTLVNQIVGLARPDSGTITVGGVDAVAHPAAVREIVSVQAQANVPISGLTPRKAIELVGRIRGGQPDPVRRRADQLLAALDLGPWATTPSEKVSGGIARLTAFAMTAVAPGSLVILDEPTNDVDPVRRRLLWAQIRELADGGCGVLLVTHNVSEAERVVDHLAILDTGAVVGAGTPASLTAHLRDTLTFEADLAPGVDARWPEDLNGLTQGHLHASATLKSASASRVVAWAQEEIASGRLEQFALKPASLEDVYVELAGTTHDASTKELAA